MDNLQKLAVKDQDGFNASTQIWTKSYPAFDIDITQFHYAP